MLQKVGEERTRGVECRAERHAAKRFGGCAAEHAARREGCIQPTKHRSAKRREGAGSYDEWSGVSPERNARTAKRALAGCEAETGRGATNTRGAMRGKFRRRKPSTPKPLAADCAGLLPDGVYAYAENIRRARSASREAGASAVSHGHAGRPSGTGRTVAGKLAAR